MKKGFISTPLLGTIIFLTALVFVVNLSLSERNAVSQATVNAYDNRMVSLIDAYNLDAGSQMVQSIKMSVEGFLGNGCWNAFNIPANGYSASSTNLSYDRWYFCKQSLGLIKDVVCTHTTGNGGSNTAGGVISSTSLSNTYGLQQELAYLATNQNFESFNLYSTNSGNITSLLNDYAGYENFCNQLLGSSLFDCNAFAVGKFQCCPNAPTDNLKYTGTPECGANSNPYTPDIPGCGDGTFYFLLNLTNVYSLLPRVGANDSSGNVLNSNVLAYANPYVYINYPLFKYFNATYTVVQTVMNDLKSCKYNPSTIFGEPYVTCPSTAPTALSVGNDINNSLSTMRGYPFVLNFGSATTQFYCPSSSCVANFENFFNSSSSNFSVNNSYGYNQPVVTNDSNPLYVVNIGQPNQFCMNIYWNLAFSYAEGS